MVAFPRRQLLSSWIKMFVPYLLLQNVHNRPLSKMAAENSNKSELKAYTSNRKNTFTLVTLQRFSISGVLGVFFCLLTNQPLFLHLEENISFEFRV